MRIYLTDKKVFHIKNNAEKFLNGITSNTLDAPNNAFLNIHGKIVATFDQYKISQGEMILLIEAHAVEGVLQHIDKFIKLSKVEFKPEDRKVYFDLDGDASVSEDDPVIPQKKGQLIVTAGHFESNVKDQEFTLFRVQNGIPLHGVDYKDTMLLNVSMKDFVSFTKGCFLGQEPISKVYNRSKPSWKLVVKAIDECSDEEKAKMTSKVTDPKTKREMGFVFARND